MNKASEGGNKMATRCKPGELCLVVKSGIAAYDGLLAPALGTVVTVRNLCRNTPASDPGWHYAPVLSLPIVGGGSLIVHAFPDICLRPIRPPEPEETVEIPKELFTV